MTLKKTMNHAHYEQTDLTVKKANINRMCCIKSGATACTGKFRYAGIQFKNIRNDVL